MENNNQFSYAGWFRRAMAFIIDLAIFLVIFVPFSVAIGGLAAHARPVNPYHQWIMIAVVSLFWLLLATMESLAGATLGKKALGLRVTDLNGNRLTFGDALIRNFVKVPLWTLPQYLFPKATLALLWGGGQIPVFLFCAFTAKHQAIYDLLAGSIVIRDTPSLRQMPEKIY